MLSFTHKPFDALTLRELHDIYFLRDEVFVVGQRVTAEPEVDGRDPECTHVLGRDAEGRIVATARIFFDEQPIRVGRVAVATPLQRQRAGTALMTYVHELVGDRPATMNAQAHLVPWYSRLGWRPVGDVFIEADIPHVRMDR